MIEKLSKNTQKEVHFRKVAYLGSKLGSYVLKRMQCFFYYGFQVLTKFERLNSRHPDALIYMKPMSESSLFRLLLESPKALTRKIQFSYRLSLAKTASTSKHHALESRAS